ncbi:MAG: PLP-dependent lyase/thiolase [archaeon]
MVKSNISQKEEQILKSINVNSDNDPKKPEYPPWNPRFPTTPTYKIKIPGFNEVLLKDESKNPTGTHKGRLAWEIVCWYKSFLEAKKLGAINTELPQFSVISSGNSAYALAYFLQKFDLPKPKILIDINTKKSIIDFLRKQYCELYFTDLSRKALESREILALTENRNGFDITSNNALEPASIFYDWMSFEIINNAPNYVLLPFGSGDLFTNICNCIKKQIVANKKDPRLMVDINKLRTCNIIGATVNIPTTKADKLYSPHLPFVHFDEHWLAFYKKFGYIGESSGVSIVSEEHLEEAIDMAKQLGVECEPSGIAGLAYLLQNKQRLPKNKRILIVSTGKGVI